MLFVVHVRGDNGSNFTKYKNTTSLFIHHKVNEVFNIHFFLINVNSLQSKNILFFLFYFFLSYLLGRNMINF